MPHIIIEHSINFSKSEANRLLLALNQAIVAIKKGNFNIDDCKARAIYCPNYVIADGKINSNNDFLHITIRILSSRSKEIQQKLAKNILKTTYDFLKTDSFDNNPTSISVIIEEMDRDIYQKILYNI